LAAPQAIGFRRRTQSETPLRLSAANASAIGLLRVLLAASLLVPAALFGGITWLDYRTAIKDAEHDLQRTSEVASENAEKVFDSQVQLAERVNDLTSGLDADAVRALERPLHDTLNSVVARLPHVASILIASKSGKPLVSAEIFPVPRDVDLRGRDYFDAIIGGDKGPFISTLQVGDVYRRPFFGLARPWTGLDGIPKGVIDVAVLPAFFVDYYQTLVDESAGSASGKVVTLVRSDGQILLRYPPLAAVPSHSPVPTVFLDAIRHAPDEGVYSTRSIVDPNSPLRLFAYRRVRGYPLYVAAGRSWSALRA
jgi:two-component system NtrC family sensor kinase